MSVKKQLYSDIAVLLGVQQYLNNLEETKRYIRQNLLWKQKLLWTLKLQQLRFLAGDIFEIASIAGIPISRVSNKSDICHCLTKKIKSPESGPFNLRTTILDKANITLPLDHVPGVEDSAKTAVKEEQSSEPEEINQQEGEGEEEGEGFKSRTMVRIDVIPEKMETDQNASDAEAERKTTVTPSVGNGQFNLNTVIKPTGVAPPTKVPAGVAEPQPAQGEITANVNPAGSLVSMLRLPQTQLSSSKTGEPPKISPSPSPSPSPPASSTQILAIEPDVSELIRSINIHDLTNEDSPRNRNIKASF